MILNTLQKEVAALDGAYISAFNMLQDMTRNDVEVYHYCDAATFGVQPHRHDFYELYCLLSDRYIYHVENNQYELRPGSLILVPPGETHWPELEGPPRDIERIVLWLNPGFISSLSVFLPKTLGTIGENLQGFSSYDGEFRMPLVLAQASPIFHSSCEGKLGIEIGRASCRERV